MIQISAKDKERVLEAIRKGTIDAADVSYPNLIDAMILKMNQEGILELLEMAFLDKRSDNMNIPFHLILTLAITAIFRNKYSAKWILSLIFIFLIVQIWSLSFNDNCENSGVITDDEGTHRGYPHFEESPAILGFLKKSSLAGSSNTTWN